jgi:hypothetical protein
MPYFKKGASPAKPYWCPNCEAWFSPGNHSCTVQHAPGSCCHNGETEVDPPPSDSCCCVCPNPTHTKTDYAETCVRCGKHRPPNGPVHWSDE